MKNLESFNFKSDRKSEILSEQIGGQKIQESSSKINEKNPHSELIKNQEVEINQVDSVLYISDLHGDIFETVEALKEILESKNPDQINEVVFLGDVVGSKDSDRLQRLFYNYFKNNLRSKIQENQISNPEFSLNDLNDEEILSINFKVEDKNNELDGQELTLRDGLKKLLRKECDLVKNEDAKQKRLNLIDKLNDHQLAIVAKKYFDFKHYGHYVSNLSGEMKDEFANNFYDSFAQLAGVCHQLQDLGIKTYFMQGNHEAQPPHTFEPGIEEVKPLEFDDDLEEIANDLEVEYVKDFQIFETENTIQILLPIKAVKQADEDENYVKIIKNKVEDLLSKDPNKKIIISSHVQPNHQKHYGRNSQPNFENEVWIRGLNKVLDAINPDEIYYGHVHNKLDDQETASYNLNEKTKATYLGIKQRMQKVFEGKSDDNLIL